MKINRNKAIYSNPIAYLRFPTISSYQYSPTQIQGALEDASCELGWRKDGNWNKQIGP